MRVLKGHTGPVRCVAYHPGGEQLTSGGDDGAVRIWEGAARGRRSWHRKHRDCVRGLAYSAHGTQLASAAWDDSVMLGTISKVRVVLQDHKGGAWSVAFSPSGDQVVTGAGCGAVAFYSRGGERGDGFLEHRRPVSALAFTPDGRTLVSASHDGKVILWDALWRKPLHTLSMHEDWVRSVAVSPDGRLLASSDIDGFVVLTDLAERKELRRWRGHTGPVAQVAFAPQSLLSVGWDGIVRQWDAGSGREIAAYNWGAGRLLCVAVAPHGMTAAAGAEDGSVVVWDLEE